MWREVATRCNSPIIHCLKKETAPSYYLFLRNVKYFRSDVQCSTKYGKDNAGSDVKETVSNYSEGHESEVDRKGSSPSESSFSNNLAANVSGKYKIFKDEDSEVIFDIEEERRKVELQSEPADLDEFAGISLKRGSAGVFDLYELVEVLKMQKAQDIFVVSIPPSLGYVSEMVIATGRSTRHLQAIVEFLRKLHKKKKGKGDPFLKVEGVDSKNWKALDLGNIALHVFLKSTREEYDLESLWALGADYDNLCRKPDDPLIALLKTPIDLEGLEPASSSAKN